MFQILIKLCLITLLWSQVSNAEPLAEAPKEAPKNQDVQASKDNETNKGNEVSKDQSTLTVPPQTPLEEGKEADLNVKNTENSFADIRTLNYQNKKGQFSFGYLKLEDYASLNSDSKTEFIDVTITVTKNYFHLKYGLLDKFAVSVAMGNGTNVATYHELNLSSPSSTNSKLSSSGELDRVYMMHFLPLKNETGSLALNLTYIPTTMDAVSADVGKSGNMAQHGNYLKYEMSFSRLMWDVHNISLSYDVANTSSGKSNNSTKTSPRKYESESESTLALRYRYLIKGWAFVDLVTKKVSTSVAKSTDLNSGSSSSMSADSRSLSGISFGLAFKNKIKLSAETVIDASNRKLTVTSSSGNSMSWKMGFESRSALNAEIYF